MTRSIALTVVLAMALGACTQESDNSQPAPSESPAVATENAETPPPASSDTADAPQTSAEAYDGPIPKPIMIGGDGPEMDACGTFAKVANLDPKGDNFLSVRDAPSTSTKERDRLAPGQGVSVCVSENGWSGIIYGKPGDKTLDCGVGMPAQPAQPYRGSCRQGWVDSRYLEQVAG